MRKVILVSIISLLLFLSIFIPIPLNKNVNAETVDHTQFTVWYTSDIHSDVSSLTTALNDLKNNDITWDIALFLGDLVENWAGNCGVKIQNEIENTLKSNLNDITYGGRTHNRSDVYFVLGNHDTATETTSGWHYHDDYYEPNWGDGTNFWNPYDWDESHPGDENNWRRFPINLTDSDYDGINDDNPASDNPSDPGGNDRYVYGVENYTFDVGNLKFICLAMPPEHQRFPNASLNWMEKIIDNNPNKMIIINMHYRLDNRSANPRLCDKAWDGVSAFGKYCDGTDYGYARESHPDYIETLNKVVAKPNVIMWCGGHLHGFPSYWDNYDHRNHSMVFIENTSATGIQSVVNGTYPPHNVTHLNVASLGKTTSEINHPASWGFFLTFTNNSRKVIIKARWHQNWLCDTNNWYQQPNGIDYPDEHASTWGNFSVTVQKNVSDKEGTFEGLQREYVFYLPEPFVLKGGSSSQEPSYSDTESFGIQLPIDYTPPSQPSQSDSENFGLSLPINYEGTAPNPPNPPTHFNATATGICEITLTWNRSPNATKTIIRQSDTDLGSWTLTTGELIYNGTGQIYKHSVASHTTHFYASWSWNANSGYSTSYVTASATSFSNAINPPVANFTYNIDGLTVNFTDTSTFNASIVNWTWNFGDGNVSYEQNPTHTYAENGTYFVILNVTDSNALYDVETKEINISSSGGGWIEHDVSYYWIFILLLLLPIGYFVYKYGGIK